MSNTKPGYGVIRGRVKIFYKLSTTTVLLTFHLFHEKSYEKFFYVCIKNFYVILNKNHFLLFWYHKIDFWGIFHFSTCFWNMKSVQGHSWLSHPVTLFEVLKVKGLFESYQSSCISETLPPSDSTVTNLWIYAGNSSATRCLIRRSSPYVTMITFKRWNSFYFVSLRGVYGWKLPVVTIIRNATKFPVKFESRFLVPTGLPEFIFSRRSVRFTCATSTTRWAISFNVLPDNLLFNSSRQQLYLCLPLFPRSILYQIYWEAHFSWGKSDFISTNYSTAIGTSRRMTKWIFVIHRKSIG